MDERARRIGRNESIFREVNEQIQALNQRFAAIGERTITIICECGDLVCRDELVVATAEYERVRADPTLFIAVVGHERPDVESVVDAGPGYNVVRKREGGPAEVARATDPRRG